MTSPAMTAMGMILGHGDLHEPRAGAREGRRQARGHLGLRLRALRDAVGPPASSPARASPTRSPGYIEREPDWTALPATTPPHVRGVLERCLRKDPSRRLRDIGDARMQLEEGGAASDRRDPSTAPARLAHSGGAGGGRGGRHRCWVGWAAPHRPGPTRGTPVQLDLLFPKALSSSRCRARGWPSRRTDEDRLRRRRRRIASDLRAFARRPGLGAAARHRRRVLPGFSPDGQSLAFLSRDRSLKRCRSATASSPTSDASRARMPRSGGPTGSIFSREGLWRVPATGGTPARLTSLDQSRGEVAHTPGDVAALRRLLFTS